MFRTPFFSRPTQTFQAAALLLVAVCLPTQVSAQKPERTPRQDERNQPTTVKAGQVTGQPDRELVLKEDVEIVRGQTKINSDSAVYHQAENVVEAEGNIQIERFGDFFTGDALRLNLDTSEGFVLNPTYKLKLNNAQGGGDRIDFHNRDQATIKNATYTTCEGVDPDWYLKAGSLSIDNEKDVGTSRNMVLYFKDAPILGAPALTFPTSSARKSGVLPPVFGTTSRGGTELAVPYYFNIAPNRDLTLTPKIITRRGIQLGGEARYLENNFSGVTEFELLMDDRETDSNRYSIASFHTQKLTPELTFGLNFNQVSDDNYFSDFSHNLGTVSGLQVPSAQRLLTREATLAYAGEGWEASALVSNYQLLQDVDSVIYSRPYERLPQLKLSAWQKDLSGFDWSIDTEYTRFWLPAEDLAFRKTEPGYTENRPYVNGDRLVIRPQISYPIIGAGYFIRPQFSLHASQYELDDTGSDTTSLTRTLPTFSVDSGLIFERESNWFGNAVTQTLEPRLFYVYTPYRDQSNYPLFDTAEASFGFPQIFSENRFVGSDLIADANQLTAAVISRYLEPSGAERLRLAIGQRFYFSDQRVKLNPEAVDATDRQSDLLFALSGRITPTFGIDTAVQYSESTHKVYSANFSMQWQPERNHVLNAEYRYLRDNELDQINLSAQWPLEDRWYGVGRVSYSLPEKRVVEGLLGMEYNAGCWIFRVAARRLATSTEEANTALFFQLQLNGLSKLGSNPLQVFRSSIPGYQMIDTDNMD